MYLFENAKKNNLKNEDVFFLLRFVITGNPVGAPIGEICEIIGQKDALSRIEDAIDHIRNLKYEELDTVDEGPDDFREKQKIYEANK